MIRDAQPGAGGGLDLNALRTLKAIGDTGTITAAAARLGCSQPAVSQLVRRLERRLGTALLDRSGRVVRLTEAGRVLARHGGTVGATLDAAAREVAALSGMRAGRLRLLAFPSSAATLVPTALARLRVAHPDLRIALAEAEPAQSLAELRAGDCEIALTFSFPGTDAVAGTGPGREPDDLAGLVVRHLLDDAAVLALPAGHPLTGRPRLHLRDLAEQTWIAGSPACRGPLVRACAAARIVPDIAYATDDHLSVLALVAAGLGVALLPGLVVATAARYPGVALRAIGGSPRRAVHAATTPDLLRVPAVAAAISTLADAATEF